MHTSVLNETLSADLEVGAGEVVVADGFFHAGRGPVATPASPLLAEDLRRRGLVVRSARFATGGPSSVGTRQAVVHATSYLRRDSTAVGFAVAVGRGDPASAATVCEVVAGWASALRTRRILRVAAEPLCPGARRALGMAAARRGPIHVVGRLRASPEALADLAQGGVQYAEDLDEVPDKATVMFPDHGVPIAVRAEAAARGLSVVDATCELVAETHCEARVLAGRGGVTIVVGRADLDVVPALLDEAPGAMVLVQNPDEARTVPIAADREVSVLVAPGLPLVEAMPTVAMLRERFGRIVPQHPQTYCYAATDRRVAVVSSAVGADLVLVAGGRDCHDAAQLAAWARESGTVTRTVDSLGDLCPEHLAGASAVTLCEALSAPTGLADQITAALSGLGPLAVAIRTAGTEPLRADVPDSARTADPEPVGGTGAVHLA